MKQKIKTENKTITLTWYERSNGKYYARYFVNKYFWASNNTADWFANGIDDPEKHLYRVIRKGGKIVCREASYNGI